MATEKNRVCPTDVCEKIFKVITLRSLSPRLPKHYTPSPNLSSSAKTPNAPIKPPLQGAHHSPISKTIEEHNLVRIEFDYSGVPSRQNVIAKSPKPNILVQKSGQVAKSSPNTERARTGLPPEPVLEMVQPKPVAGTGQLQLGKVASKVQPELSLVSSAHEKPKNTTQVAVEQNPKAELPQVNNEEGKKSKVNVEDKFTEYINRAKMNIRSISNTGEGKKAQEVDSSRDRFSEYINRVKLKMRSSSGIGGGKSESFKVKE